MRGARRRVSWTRRRSNRFWTMVFSLPATCRMRVRVNERTALLHVHLPAAPALFPAGLHGRVGGVGNRGLCLATRLCQPDAADRAVSADPAGTRRVDSPAAAA